MDRNGSGEALRSFLRRVWREDVSPLLRGDATRRRSAEISGKIAATGGLLIDGMLGLRGKPFTRLLTVVGASAGAMLPDAWDWAWFRAASPRARKVVQQQVRRRAAELSQREALKLFGLTHSSSEEELRAAWRRIAKRWHPDIAPSPAQRQEYHVRMVAFRAAYDQLRAAYAQGKLPLVRRRRRMPR